MDRISEAGFFLRFFSKAALAYLLRFSFHLCFFSFHICSLNPFPSFLHVVNESCDRTERNRVYYHHLIRFPDERSIAILLYFFSLIAQKVTRTGADAKRGRLGST